MIEILVLVKPLGGQVTSVGIYKSLVDWGEVLQSSHGRDESVSWVKNWLVA